MRRQAKIKFFPLITILTILTIPVTDLSTQQIGENRTIRRDNRNTVIVPSKPGKKLEIEPPQPIPKGKDQILVDDWIGLHEKASENLKADQSIILILADDIEFPKRDYSVHQGNTPKNVILIANRIRLTGPVVFNLRGTRGVAAPDKRAGGNFILMARQFMCDPNGKLTIFSDGGTSREVGGNGGNIIIAAEQFDVQDKPDTGLKYWKILSGIFPPKPPVPFPPKPPVPHSPKHPESSSQKEDKTPIVSNPLVRRVSYFNKGGSGRFAGRDGEFHIMNKFMDVTDKEPYAPFAISRWIISLLDALRSDIVTAAALDDRARVIQLFLKFKGLVEQINKEKMLHSDHREAYNILMEWFVNKKAGLSSLWYFPVNVSQGGVQQPINVFVEGMDLQPKLPPTETLVCARSDGGRKVLGLLEFNSQHPDEIVMNFEVEMTVDPWVRRQVSNAKELIGWESPVDFTNWTLHPGDISEIGIKDSKIEPSGNRLQVSLKLDTNKASLAMFKLFSSSGLRLRMGWEYKDDRNMTDIWEGALSLLRRAEEPEIAISQDGQITNKSKAAITVEYVQVGNNFYSIQPVPEIPPGQTIALSLPEGVDRTQKIRIPSEAVVYDLDPFDLEGNFLIVSDEQLIEKIIVTNLLGFDVQRGGALERVEINVEYIVGEEPNASSVSHGPYPLAPVGSVGSEITLSFLKPRQGTRRVRITGIAVYENGQQTLTEKTFSDLSIKVTKDMLPPITQ